MTTCPRCGCDNTSDSNFCRRCGSRLVPLESTETTLAYKVGENEEPGVVENVATLSGPILIIRAGGDREGEVIALQKDVVTIGRSPQNDLFLDDVTVSRHHARIVADDESVILEDLNSLNGTYVNRKRVERHELADGDELQIGKFKLDFLVQGEKV